jgi:hypothetical protein
MRLDLSYEFPESAVVDFETTQDRGMDISLVQLHASLLEGVEEGIETTEDLVKIMKDHLRCLFLTLGDCGNAIRQHETHIHLCPFEIFHEVHQVFFLSLSGPG